MSLKKLLVTAIMLSGLLIFADQPTKTVEAEGMGETIEKAAKNACENAVRKAFGEVVDSVTETKDDELVESTISASSGFIVSLEPIDAQFDEANKYYKVKLRAVVATERLKDHITRFKKSKTEVDISSQLKASDDAETQEKNAMKVVLYLAEETPKTLRLEDNYKISVDKTLKFDFELTHDQYQLTKMYEDAVKILRSNGYVTNEKLAAAVNRDVGYFDFEGSVININGTAYNNPEAILYSNDFSNQDEPHNAWPRLPRTEIRIELHDKQSKLLDECSIYEGLFLKWKNNSNAGPTERRTRSWFIFKDESGVENRRWNCPFQNVSEEKLKNAAKIVICVDQGKRIGRKIVIAEIPLNGEDLFAQAESKKNRVQQYVALLSKFDREYYKSILAKAEFKYDRFQNAGKMKIDLSIDKRTFVNASRKLSSQLEELGLDVKDGHCNTPRDHVQWTIGKWHVLIPDPEKALAEAMEKDLFKYKHRLVLEFKDKTGELLQKESLNLPREIHPRTSGMWGKGIDSYRADSDFEDSFEMLVNFDIPEDLKKVAAVECHIEERNAE